MKKTTHYQLNKPEVTDPLRVEDFNENAEIIDAALNSVRNEAVSLSEQVRAEAANNLAAYKTSNDAAVAAVNSSVLELNDRIYFGSWVGDGTKNRVIQLGFEPKFILLLGHYYNSPTLYSTINILTQERQYCINNYGCSAGGKDSGGLLSGSTITLGELDLWNNRNNEIVYYLAIK